MSPATTKEQLDSSARVLQIAACTIQQKSPQLVSRWLQQNPTNTLDHFIPWFLVTFNDYEYDGEDDDDSIQRAAKTLATNLDTALQQMIRISRPPKPSQALNLVDVTPIGATVWNQVNPPQITSWPRSKTTTSSATKNKQKTWSWPKSHKSSDTKNDPIPP